MGKDVVQFSCHHCNHCCTEVICLPTPWDVIQIVNHTQLVPEEFLDWVTPDDIEEVRANDPTWLRCGRQKYMMALKREPLKGCHFLNPDNKLCSIYTARPLLCRLYPFRLMESRSGEFLGFGLHKGVGCPKHRDGIVATAPLYKLYLEDSEHQHDYHDLVKVYNAQRHPGKRPQDFLKLFIHRVNSVPELMARL